MLAYIADLCMGKEITTNQAAMRKTRTLIGVSLLNNAIAT
jgi:hypothetical protein